MYRRNASETSADRNLPIKIVLLDGSTLSIRRPAGYFYGKLIDGRVAFSAVSDFIPRSRKYLVYDLVGGSHWGSTRGSAIAAAIAAESSTPRSNPTNRWGVTFKKGDIVQYQGANYRYWKLDKADDFSRAYGRQAVLTYALSGPFLADDTREAGIGDLTKPRSNPRRNGAHSVTIEGTLWRDSYGNTYHRAYCYVDGKHVLTTPITYGYGNQFSYTGWQALADKGIVPALSRTQPPSGAARDAGIVFDTSYTNVKRKKDL